jgi:hypothetical protein
MGYPPSNRRLIYDFSREVKLRSPFLDGGVGVIKTFSSSNIASISFGVYTRISAWTPEGQSFAVASRQLTKGSSVSLMTIKSRSLSASASRREAEPKRITFSGS